MIITILLILAAASLGVGVLYSSKPELAIEWQKRAYASFNWRIEPISLERELRSMKVMGKILIFISMATIVYLIINK